MMTAEARRRMTADQIDSRLVQTEQWLAKKCLCIPDEKERVAFIEYRLRNLARTVARKLVTVRGYMKKHQWPTLNNDLSWNKKVVGVKVVRA